MGRTIQIPLQLAAEETSSLKLIYVDEVGLRVFAPSLAFGDSKRKVQARFHFSGNDYALLVTDPDIEGHYIEQGNGSYDLAECYLTISLGRTVQGTLLQVGRCRNGKTMMADAMREGTIYTIGHSTHGIKNFVALLKRHRINAVADVRSVPYSRWHPQFKS